MIAASTLPMGDYFAMNTDLAKVPQFHDKFMQIGANVDHLNVYEDRTQEALRGRTGGAVTLAVGMAHIFDGATARVWHATESSLKTLWKYWYHFAIMFEALFILTTIDTGTRIARFLLQEVAGKLDPALGRTAWWPGAIGSTARSRSQATTRGTPRRASASARIANEDSKAAAKRRMPLQDRMHERRQQRRVHLAVAVDLDHDVGATAERNPVAVHDRGAHPLVARVADHHDALILAMLVCTAVVVFGAAIRIWTITGGGNLAPRPVLEPAVAGK